MSAIELPLVPPSGDEADVSDGETVAVVITQFCKAGYEKEFEQWMEKVGDAVRAAPGFHSFVRMKPLSNKATTKYVTLAQFQSREALDAWKASDARSQVIGECEAMLAQPRDVEIVDHTGSTFDFWDKLATPQVLPRRPPPRWKISVIVWFHVTWMITSLTAAGFAPFLASLGVRIPLLQMLITMPLVVSTMLYLLIPLTCRLLRPWLMAPRPSFQCEPLRSLDQGFCCFGPNPRVVALEVKLAESVRRQAEQDRRLNRLELGLAAAAAGGSSEEKAATADLSVPSPISDVVAQQLDELRNETGEVTLAFRHSVKTAYCPLFEQLHQQLYHYCQEQLPGCRTHLLIRAPQGGNGGSNQYLSLLKYDSFEQLQAMLEDQERVRLVTQMCALTSDVSRVEAVTAIDPVESLFLDPAFSTSPHSSSPHKQPPKWKTMLVTMSCLLVVINSFKMLWPKLGLSPAKLTLPGFMFITCGISVFVVSYFAAPFVGMLLDRWLNTPRARSSNPVVRVLDEGFPCLH